MMVDFIRLKKEPGKSSSWLHDVQIIGADSLNTVRNKVGFSESHSLNSMKPLNDTCLFFSPPKNVLVVDNIIETGNTLKKLCKLLQEFEPKTIKTCR